MSIGWSCEHVKQENVQQPLVVVLVVHSSTSDPCNLGKPEVPFTILDCELHSQIFKWKVLEYGQVERLYTWTYKSVEALWVLAGLEYFPQLLT
jgi:hypothetical protein